MSDTPIYDAVVASQHWSPMELRPRLDLDALIAASWNIDPLLLSRRITERSTTTESFVIDADGAPIHQWEVTTPSDVYLTEDDMDMFDGIDEENP